MSTPPRQIALCRRMRWALGHIDTYDPIKVLEQAYDEIDEPHLVAELFVAIQPRLASLPSEGHELLRRLSFRTLEWPMPYEANLGYYDDGDDYGFDNDYDQARYDSFGDRFDNFDAGAPKKKSGSDSRKPNSGGNTQRNSSGDAQQQQQNQGNGSWWDSIQATADLMNEVTNKYPPRGTDNSAGQGGTQTPAPRAQDADQGSARIPQNDNSGPANNKSGVPSPRYKQPQEPSSNNWGKGLLAAGLFAVGLALLASRTEDEDDEE